MIISVVIVNYNAGPSILKCIDALIRDSAGLEIEIIVVDNHSQDGSTDAIEKAYAPRIHIVKNRINKGFAAACNQAYRISSGEYILLLNPDAYIRGDSLQNAVTFMRDHSECGICGGRLLTPSGELSPSARRFPSSLFKFFMISGLRHRFPSSRLFSKPDFSHFDHRTVKKVDWLPGAFMMIRRKMIDRIGFFDERFFLYYEETDLCLRARKAGWKVFFVPNIEVVHIGGISAETRADVSFTKHGAQILNFRLRSEYLYFRKNYGVFSVIANAGVEILWHLMRYFANTVMIPDNRSMKRRESKEIIFQIFIALHETHFGRKSPEIPW